GQKETGRRRRQSRVEVTGGPSGRQGRLTCRPGSPEVKKRIISNKTDHWADHGDLSIARAVEHCGVGACLMRASCVPSRAAWQGGEFGTPAARKNRKTNHVIASTRTH